MSGIKIHTADPINTTKTSAPLSQMSPAHHSPGALEFSTAAPSPNDYPAARPGQTVLAPTKTVNASSSSNPPAPQPGAVPAPGPPTTTAKAMLPPPPKPGEKLLPPEAYRTNPTSTPSVMTDPPPYPPQMSYNLREPSAVGIPPSSTTSTTTQPAGPALISLPNVSDGSRANTSLAHPPGYVQNQHATDMTVEQRQASRQAEMSNPAKSDPVLGYVGKSGGTPGGFDGATAGVWEGAKALAGQVGQKASELHGDIWEKINRGQ